MTSPARLNLSTDGGQVCLAVCEHAFHGGQDAIAAGQLVVPEEQTVGAVGRRDCAARTTRMGREMGSGVRDTVVLTVVAALLLQCSQICLNAF